MEYDLEHYVYNLKNIQDKIVNINEILVDYCKYHFEDSDCCVNICEMLSIVRNNQNLMNEILLKIISIVGTKREKTNFYPKNS